MRLIPIGKTVELSMQSSPQAVLRNLHNHMFWGLPVSQSAGVAMTKTTEIHVLTVLVVGSPKSECQDSWVLARVLFLTQRWLPYSYVLTWSFFFVHTKRKISLASYYLSTRTLILLKQGYTLTPSFSHNYLHRSPISKYSLTENWDFKIGILWEHKHPIYKNLEIEIYYSIFQYKNVSFRQPLFQICDWKYSEDQRSDHQVYQCIQEFCTISISHLD